MAHALVTRYSSSSRETVVAWRTSFSVSSLRRDEGSQPTVAAASATPFTLTALISARLPDCPPSIWSWLHDVPPPRVAYLAVARTGSESLGKALREHHSKKALEQRFTAHMPHSHDCTLRDVETAGATHVLISLRHPADRLMSGVKRRLEGARGKSAKLPNADFLDAFGPFGANALNAFVSALRDVAHPLHTRAMNQSIGPMRQNFLLPVSEFYLANGRTDDRAAHSGFVCTPTLAGDVQRVTQSWCVRDMHVQGQEESIHRSHTTMKPLSAENRAWVDTTWAADVALWRLHCGEGAATAASDERPVELSGTTHRASSTTTGTHTAVRTCHAPAPAATRIVFLHYHKTGSLLSTSLMHTTADVLGLRVDYVANHTLARLCCPLFDCPIGRYADRQIRRWTAPELVLSPSSVPPCYAVVHMVRDPARWALSFYDYHVQTPTPERWTAFYRPSCEFAHPEYAMVVPGLRDEWVRVAQAACNAIVMRHPSFTVLEHLRSLPEEEGLRLMTLLNVLKGTNSTLGHQRAGGDLMRSAANQLVLKRRAGSAADGAVHARPRVVVLWMDEAVEKTAATMEALATFLVDAVSESRPRRASLVTALASRLRLDEAGDYARLLNGSHSSHITRDGSAIRRSRLVASLEADPIFAEIFELWRRIFAQHSPLPQADSSSWAGFLSQSLSHPQAAHPIIKDRVAYYMGVWNRSGSLPIHPGLRAEVESGHPVAFNPCRVPRDAAGNALMGCRKEHCIQYAKELDELLDEAGLHGVCTAFPVQFGDTPAGAECRNGMWLPAPLYDGTLVPLLSKSRLRAPSGGILMNLNRRRHYGFFDKPIPDAARLPWTARKDALIWRGGDVTGRKQAQTCLSIRLRFVSALKGYLADGIDVAFAADVNHTKECPETCGTLSARCTPGMTVEQMMTYRYALSLEGNDVATDLKWKLASGIVVLMPRPTAESWLMEFALQPAVHYIEVGSPEEVPAKLAWLRANQKQAERISKAARAWMAPFAHVQHDRIMAREVLSRVALLLRANKATQLPTPGSS